MVDGRAAGSRPSVEYRGSSLPVALPYHRSPAMPKAVSRMLMLLCTLVAPLPVGTNLGLLHLLWMLVSGRLLAARGAVIPGLDACGLSRQAPRPHTTTVQYDPVSAARDTGRRTRMRATTRCRWT